VLPRETYVLAPSRNADPYRTDGPRAMTRNVTLHLDEFGQQSLDRLVGQTAASPAAALRAAARYYLADKEEHRTAWRARRFRPGPTPSPGIRVAYDDETWAALGEEAERQGVTPEELAVHALLYLLADVESGQLPGGIGETPGEEE
jgi:hypothetical protein